MEIGKRIAELRKERKWTQQELADKLYVTDNVNILFVYNLFEKSVNFQKTIRLVELKVFVP